MLLVSCMKQATPPPGAQTGGIEGIQWYLTEVGGSPVSPMADDKQPHILLDPAENQATGFAGCNNFFGQFAEVDAGVVSGPIGSTMMMCPSWNSGSISSPMTRNAKGSLALQLPRSADSLIRLLPCVAAGARDWHTGRPQ